MPENRLEFLKNAFSNYRVQILDDGFHAIIFNPFYNENINVHCYPEDDYTPFHVCFSFQHCHLTGKEDVVDWIIDIITGDKFAIEFFKNGKNCFGGDIKAEALDNISYEKIEKYTGYYGSTKLFRIVDSFKVRGWNPESNFDAVLVFEKDGTIAIEKHTAVNC